MTIDIGDLGCPGIDVDKWCEANRAPLFPGKVNRWIIARTTRDNPAPDDLKTTLAATFERWFDGTPLDPAAPFDGTTRSAAADLIRLERVSVQQLTFTQPVRRREELPGPGPLLNPSGGVVWLEVTFAYRGVLLSMPWPVRTGAMAQLESSAKCPIGTDWMLDAVAFPVADVPPEMSTAEKAAATLGDAASKAGDAASKAAGKVLDSLWTPLLLAAGGLVLYVLVSRTLARESSHVSS